MSLSIDTAVVSPEHAAEALALEGVGKRYGRREYVLQNVNRTFEPGRGTALVGPNGSGKTTLLRLLMCLSFPTEGRIRYGDLDIHDRPYRFLQHVGIVNDGAALPEHLTGEEVLTLVLRARTGSDDPDRRARIFEAVRLDERRTERIGTYSTGMRQKTQLAAALVHRPPLLLLDEPFSGLDTATRRAVIELLAAFKSAGGLLVFSSHQADVLDALADEQVLMAGPARKAS